MSCKVHFTSKHHWAKIEFRTLGKINLSIYLQYYLNWLEILSSWLSCSFMSCLLLSVVGLLKVEKLAFSVGGGWEILAAKLMSICVICNHCSQEKHNGRECLFLFFFFPQNFCLSVCEYFAQNHLWPISTLNTAMLCLFIASVQEAFKSMQYFSLVFLRIPIA